MTTDMLKQGGTGRSLWTTWWTALSVLFWRLWVSVMSQPFLILVHSRAKSPMPSILMIWIRLVGWLWKSELSLFGVKFWFGCRWYWDIAWCWGIRIFCFKRTRILLMRLLFNIYYSPIHDTNIKSMLFLTVKGRSAFKESLDVGYSRENEPHPSVEDNQRKQD